MSDINNNETDEMDIEMIEGAEEVKISLMPIRAT